MRAAFALVLFLGGIYSNCHLLFDYFIVCGLAANSVLFYGNSSQSVCLLSVGRVNWNGESLGRESVLSGAEV